MVAHTWNDSYLGGKGRRIAVQKEGQKHETLLKKYIYKAKSAGGVT
jgi:hypothetical protein